MGFNWFQPAPPYLAAAAAPSRASLSNLAAISAALGFGNSADGESGMSPWLRAWQILLAASYDAVVLKKRGFRHVQGHGRYCSPHHRMLFHSGNEGLDTFKDTVCKL